MAIRMMNLIISVGRNMKCMTTLNIYMVPLKTILDINDTYSPLKQPMAENILWRVTIFFIYKIMGERGRGGYSEKI